MHLCFSFTSRLHGSMSSHLMNSCLTGGMREGNGRISSQNLLHSQQKSGRADLDEVYPPPNPCSLHTTTRYRVEGEQIYSTKLIIFPPNCLYQEMTQRESVGRRHTADQGVKKPQFVTSPESYRPLPFTVVFLIQVNLRCKRHNGLQIHSILTEKYMMMWGYVCS